MKISKKVDEHGTIRYRNELGQLHREDGPAVEYSNGDKTWWYNGKCHREDGPAVQWSNGYKSWYLNDQKLSEAEHKLRTSKEIVLTMDEIAAKFDISVEGLKITK